MDKRVIFAVAGSGKTTYIVNNMSREKRSLVVTYTNGNYDNLRRKITDKFGGSWPENITLMRYFPFLYSFCYKPFLANTVKARGILFDQEIIIRDQKLKRRVKRSEDVFYMTSSKYFYSNRLAYYIENKILGEVKDRIIKYFDELLIDEVQDIAGRDFNFLEQIMLTNINMLFVGDYYQHTFDTSRDGNTNKTLFDDTIAKYEARFKKKGFLSDNTTLINSRRCSKNVCQYIQNHLGITISSNRHDTDNTSIEFITNAELIESILNDNKVVKFHYQNGARFGYGHKNWGESKGEDHHQDICVLLNKKTINYLITKKLNELPFSTRNKLYVAITRARGNVYLIDEASIGKKMKYD